MTRQQAISEIESLFPPDSEFQGTAEKGQQLLEQAKREVNGWKTEPTEVLIRFAQLCRYEERKTARKV